MKKKFKGKLSVMVLIGILITVVLPTMIFANNHASATATYEEIGGCCVVNEFTNEHAVVNIEAFGHMEKEAGFGSNDIIAAYGNALYGIEPRFPCFRNCNWAIWHLSCRCASPMRCGNSYCRGI